MEFQQTALIPDESDVSTAEEVEAPTEAAAAPKKRAKQNVLDLANAKALYPSCNWTTEAEWEAALIDRPDVVWAILLDLYSLTKDEEDRENGVRRVGRRPQRLPTSVDELLKTVLPASFSEDPFAQAMTDLLADRNLSLNALSQRTGITRSAIQRYAMGERTPDLMTIVVIAKALRRNPAYFVEYRAHAIAEGIAAMLMKNPTMSARIVRDLRSPDSPLNQRPRRRRAA